MRKRYINRRFKKFARNVNPVRSKLIYTNSRGKFIEKSARVFYGIAIFGLLFSSFPLQRASAAISQVQKADANCSSTSCTATATISSATANNLLIAVCGGRANSGTVSSSVAGFTSAASVDNGTVHNETYYKIAAGGETSVACAFTSSSNMRGVMTVFEYSGTATATPLDKTATNTGSGTTLTTGTTATTAQADELLIAGFTITGAPTFSSWTNSFSEQSDHSISSVAMGTADRIVSATSTYSSGATSSASGTWAGNITTFKAAAAAPSGTFSILTQEGYTIENDDGTSIGSGGGVTQEQVVTATCQDTDGDCTATATITTATADNLLIGVCAGEAQFAAASLSMSGYTSAVGPTSNSNLTQEIYYKIAAGTETSVSCTNSTGSANVVVWLTVFEYSGMETTGVVDQTATSTGSSSTPSTGTTGTTTVADSLLIAGLYTDSDSTYSSWTNSFTEESEQTQPNPGASASGTASRIVSSTGTYSTSATATNSSSWIGQIATFKSGSGGVSGDPDETSALAGSEFSAGKTISNVRAGERMIIRMHLSNTGDGAVGANEKIGLFYDNNDGWWSRVNSVGYENGGSNCDVSDWDCEDVITTDDVGRYADMAIGPGGWPWVVYHDETNDDLEIARYVGSGGTGCASSEWECDVIDSTNDVGEHASIAIDAAGNAWVSFYDSTNGNLEVARYVGSGGSGCASSAWTCETVDSTDDVGQYSSIAIDSSGNAWVSFYDATGGDLLVAEYVGDASGSCDDTDWDCTDVSTTDDVGLDTSIAFHPDGNAWVSYFDTTGDDLVVAEHVGTGGTGCASSAWDCTDVYTSGVAGEDSSIAFDGGGNAWVSFYHNGNDDLIVSNYVGSGGSGCASGAWSCTSVDTSGVVGVDTSLQFDVSGAASVTYKDDTSDDLMLANYVGSGGSGCASSAWNCTTLESTGDTGAYSSLAFDGMGRAWVAYSTDVSSNFDLHVSRLARAGLIINSPAQTSKATDTLAESHADMGSATDTTDRDDADCLAGSATWNDGVWTGGNVAENVDLPVGDTTTQCTEITFVIDTSQALHGTTYRFVAASSDSFNPGKAVWRGPDSVAADGYPTISISEAGDQTFRYAKGTIGAWDTDCDDTSWECTTLTNDADDSARYIDLVSDKNGKIWVSSYENDNNNLEVGAYVGSSGSQCANSAWDCDVLDSTGTTGLAPSMAVDNHNNPWVAFRNDNSNLEIAKYVGSGGDCNHSSWECQEVDDGATTIGIGSSITFDETGNAWISYLDVTNSDLKLARYVGENGSGCASGVTDWACEKIDDITTMDTTNAETSIKVSNGVAWIAYTFDGTADDLYVARYVGSGGTGCQTEAWDCGAVYDTSVESGRIDMTLDNNGDPWIAFEGSSGSGAMIAEYVGTSGSGCAAGVTDWNCVEIEATDVDWISISADSDGDPWVVYTEATGDKDLIAAEYVSSGGSGCTSSAWDCTGVDTSTTTPSWVSLTFDAYGIPWIAYEDDQGSGDTDVLLARLKLPPNSLGSNVSVPFDGTRAHSGDAAYRLDSGSSPHSIDYSSCGAAIDYQGYCALNHPDGTKDTVSAEQDERPIYTFATSFGSNAHLPDVELRYLSSLAPSTSGSTGDVLLQVFRFGTTNQWETITTDSTSSDCSTSSCLVTGNPANTASEYFETIDGRYWVYFRLMQTESGSESILFRLDSFKAAQPGQLLRHGRTFVDTISDPFIW